MSKRPRKEPEPFFAWCAIIERGTGRAVMWMGERRETTNGILAIEVDSLETPFASTENKTPGPWRGGKIHVRFEHPSDPNYPADDYEGGR